MKLHGLGYIGLKASDPSALLSFWTDVVGMMPARALPGESFGSPSVTGSGPVSGGSGKAPDGSIYLKMDDYQWRIGIHPDSTSGLAYLGFEVEDDVALIAATRRLTPIVEKRVRMLRW